MSRALRQQRAWRAFFKAAVAVSLLMFIRPDNMFREATVCALVATGESGHMDALGGLTVIQSGGNVAASRGERN